VLIRCELSGSHSCECEDGFFWVVSPFGVVEVCRRYRGVCCSCYQGGGPDDEARVRGKQQSVFENAEVLQNLIWVPVKSMMVVIGISDNLEHIMCLCA
jgi:hypothetical protein